MSPLASYAEKLYQQPGVAELCLTLQDKQRLDVNLVLFMCWHGIYHGVINRTLLQTAITLSQEWSVNVVSPLRSVRRWLPRDTALYQPLRQQVKQAELAAEFLQLDALQRLFEDLPPTSGALCPDGTAVSQNLQLYADACDSSQAESPQLNAESCHHLMAAALTTAQLS